MLQSLFWNNLIISASVSLLLLFLLPLMPGIRRRYSARWRCWLWLLLALRLLIPVNPHIPFLPSVSFGIPVQASGTGTNIVGAVSAASSQFPDSAPSEAGAATTETTAASVPSVPEILCMVWLTGIFLFMLYHLLGYAHFIRTIKRCSQPMQNLKYAALFEKMKNQMRIRRDIRFLICKNTASPLTTGFFRPILAIPGYCYEKSELTLILRHELIHFQKKDIWYKFLLTCANAVHWFNPLIYSMVALSNLDLEMSCDSEVVRNSDVDFRKSYVETLMVAVYKGNQRFMRFSTYLSGGKNIMKVRFTNILDRGKKRRGIFAMGALLAAVLLAGCLPACKTTSGQQNSSAQIISGNAGSSVASSAVTSSAARTESSHAQTTAEEASSKQNDVSSVAVSSSLTIGQVKYQNTQYGFQFLLPANWNGYQIIEKQWTGTENGKVVNGPEIVIRSPKWTAENNYQDIPIQIFTAEQWVKVVKGPSQGPGEDLFIGAAPVGPTELYHNDKYAFALPARYDFTGSEGIEEVHEIVSQSPMQPFG